MANPTQDLENLIRSTQLTLRNGLPEVTTQQVAQLQDSLAKLQDTIRLYQIMHSFYLSITEVRSSWIPKGHIEDIIKAASAHQYKPTDLETIFFDHGGIESLLVLFLSAKDTTSVLTQVAELSKQHQEDLARKFRGIEINPATSEWIQRYDRTSMTSPLRRQYAYKSSGLQPDKSPKTRPHFQTTKGPIDSEHSST